MKLTQKRVMTLCLALVFALTLSAGALAADETPIALQLNGEILDLGDTVPVQRDGSTFIPLRVIFEALGAEVAWDNDTSTATVTRGDSVVALTLGAKTVTVTVGEDSKTVEIAAAPYKEGSTTYVPVRAAAELFGLVVGWDAANRTVIIDDVDALMASNTATYEIMDKYLAYAASSSEGNYAVDGAFDLKMDMQEGDKTSSFTFDGKVSGVSSQTAAELKLEGKTNIADLMSEEELADEATAAMVAALENIEMDYIIDVENGMYYLRSPLFSTLLGLTGDDAWISLDLNALMADLGAADVLSSNLTAIESADSTQALLTAVLKAQKPVSRDASATHMLTVVNALLSDAAFEKTSTGYVADYSKIIAELAGDELPEGLELKLTLPVKNDKVVGLTFTGAFAAEGVSVAFTATEENGSAKVTLDFAVADQLKAVMNITMKQTKTTKVAATAPAEGSTILSLSDLFNLSDLGSVGIIGGADAPAVTVVSESSVTVPAEATTAAEAVPAA